MDLKTAYQKRKQWFIDRIGKRVYRPPVTCKCQSCIDGHINGILISDETHADYLHACECDEPKDEMEMINAMSNYMNGWTTEHKSLFLHNVLPGGRKTYIIQLNRGGYMNTGTGLHEKKEYLEDPQYYIDISVTPCGGVVLNSNTSTE